MEREGGIAVDSLIVGLFILDARRFAAAGRVVRRRPTRADAWQPVASLSLARSSATCHPTRSISAGICSGGWRLVHPDLPAPFLYRASPTCSWGRLTS